MNTTTRKPKKSKVITPPPPGIPTMPVRRFTVDEYHRMVEIGVLSSGEPYELIRGWIVQKMSIDPPHNYAINVLMKLFWPFCGPRVTLRIQQPITTHDSEPEPDVVIAAGSIKDYSKRHPRPDEVHVLVEVAESTLKNDQTIKLELYAQAKVQVYWIVNLIDHSVEVYTEPNGGKKPQYKQHKYYGPEDNVPLLIGGKQVGSIRVKEVLPPK